MKMKLEYLGYALLAAGSLGFSACVTSTTGATTSNPAITGTVAGGKIPKNVDLLFVQNARRVSFGKGTMTLHGVAPVTIAFSDRPERFAGHMLTSRFVPMWSAGKDSFLKDPPNATVSVLDGKTITSLVLVLRNPKLSSGNLTYEVQILEGAPPEHAGEASLFIDVIGMPLTPYSYAGAARRSFARGAYYAGGSYGPTVVHYGGYGGSYGYARGYRGTASWGGGSGSAEGYRGGSASWGGGSGSATGWRGNSVSWHRR
jgi:hypothetical protein